MRKKNNIVEKKHLCGRPFTVKSVTEGGQEYHEIEGYAAVFNNIDSYGDIIRPGAFTKTLQEVNRQRKVKFLSQHMTDRVIGVPVLLEEDNIGLKFKGRLARTQLGQETYELAEMGALDGLSIGYRTIKSVDEGDNRVLLEIDLMEVSVVTFEANTRAKISGVKSDLSPAAYDATLIKSLMALGHSQDEAVAAIKELSLEKEEPVTPEGDEPAVEGDHSETPQADKPEAPQEGDEAHEESRKSAKMFEELTHSLRQTRETIKPKG